MEKEKAQQIKSLRALLEKGIWIIDNGKEIPEFKSVYSIDWENNNLVAYFEKMQQILSYKMQYIEQFMSLSEQGILNGETINSATQALNLAIKLEEPALKYQDIELMPILKCIYWNAGFPLQAVKLCNLMVKKCIRNEYYDMTGNYFNSILQRKISLNSKRLAIMNYIKQIQNETAIFSPYEIEYKIHAENYIGRKCDQSYYLKSKKRN